MQRWTFIVCRDRGQLEALATVGPWAGHLAGAAVGIALVTPDPRGALDPRRRGAAVDHVGPRAGRPEHGPRGLGARDRERAGDRLRARRGPASCSAIPADQHCEYILSFGYPADPSELTRPPKAGGRRDLDEMVREERW